MLGMIGPGGGTAAAQHTAHYMPDLTSARSPPVTPPRRWPPFCLPEDDRGLGPLRPLHLAPLTLFPKHLVVDSPSSFKYSLRIPISAPSSPPPYLKV